MVLTLHFFRSDAHSILARVNQRAGTAIRALSAIFSCWVRAKTSGGIADTSHVALIGGHALHRARSDAHATLAGINLRAGIIIIADDAVESIGVHAEAC